MVSKFRSSSNEQGCAPILIIFIATPLTTLLRGYVGYCLWNWFIVTAGGPSLGFWHVMGFSLFVTLITFYDQNDNLDLTKTKAIQFTLTNIFVSLFSLLFGWVYTLFM